MQLHSSLFLGGLLAATLVSPAPGDRDDLAQARRLTLQKADQMARESLRSIAGLGDECTLVANLALNASVLGLREDLNLAVATCVNEESGSPGKFLACLEEAFEEFADGLEEVGEQHEARLDLCDLTGGGIYDPDLDEDDFVDGVDHPYFPAAPGATWVYQGVSSEGLEEITVTVTGDTREVDDIECIVVRDVVTLDGVLIEDTLDWYAQDEDGTVWYMGEIVQNFEDGELTDLDGSWEAGEEGALPGVQLLASATVGTTYRQELDLLEAEDAATVLSVDATVTIGLGTFTGCLQTLDFTPLEPGQLEIKTYAPGIGLVLEENPTTGERVELVSFTPGS